MRTLTAATQNRVSAESYLSRLQALTFMKDGSFECSCRSGYYGDGLLCAKGQCNEDTCSANKQCVTPTTRECECKNGFSPNVFGDCIDIDECALFVHSCSGTSECINEEGSYKCFDPFAKQSVSTSTSAIETKVTSASTTTSTSTTTTTTTTTTAEKIYNTVLVLNTYEPDFPLPKKALGL